METERDLKGKKVLVVGIGESGRAASILLKEKGAEVYATDSANSEEVKKTAEELRRLGVYVETGKHTDAFMEGCRLMVVSPAVLDTSLPMIIAAERSIPVISEIELGFWFCKAPIVAVTGTNGKTTTVTLIGSMLEESGKKPIVCGNIGEAFCGRLLEISSDNIAVLEVSSFQLKRVKDFRPHIAAIMNITQNHFDWHPDFKDYFDSKKKIYMNQRKGDFIILNYDDLNLRRLKEETVSQAYFFRLYDKVAGAYLNKDKLILNIDNRELPLCGVDEICLNGDHNKANLLCASLCSYLAGGTPDGIKKALSLFRGLPHRFQTVATINGINFIDDSKATTVDACRAALSSCKKGKVILISGGRDKGSDFTKIRGLVAEKVKALILTGEAKEKIRKDLTGTAKIYDAVDVTDAVSVSWDMAEEGDIVLLSPMCASFDMYTSYKHRGEVFQEAVANLKIKNLR